MDVREFLDGIFKNPPEAVNRGCARVALSPLLWHFRLAGMYHEHGKYKDWMKLNNPLVGHNPAHQQPKAKNKIKEWIRRVLILLNPLSAKQTPHNTRFLRASTSMGDSHDRTVSYKTSDIDNTEIPRASNVVLDSFKVDNQNRDITDQRPPIVFSKAVPLCRPKVHKIKTSFGDRWTVGHFLSCNEPQEKDDIHKQSLIHVTWSDRTYAAVVLLILWGYCFRCGMFLFNDISVPLMSALNIVSWFVLVSSQATVFYVSCTRQNHFFEFFNKWAELFQDPVTRALGIRGVASCRHIKVVIACHWIITIVNIFSAIFIMAMDQKFSGQMNTLMYFNGQRSVPVIVVSSICMTYCSFAWIAPVSFIVAICHHVTKHFEEFSQVMKLHILAAQNGFPKHFNLLRERHLAMCETVCVLDRYVRVTLGIFYSFSIGTACFILYQLVNIKMDSSVICIAVFWLTSFLGLMAVATYHLANVNSAYPWKLQLHLISSAHRYMGLRIIVFMHSVKDDLHTIQTSHITLEELAQLQVFLTKVNGPAMGFSVLGLIVVTKELMLTLFGLFMTYSVVLLQFK